MDELKPCPFCGYKQISNDDSPGTFGENPCRYGCKCPSCTASFWHPECNEINWNTRPIEDVLRAEVAALQDKIDHYSEQAVSAAERAVERIMALHQSISYSSNPDKAAYQDGINSTIDRVWDIINEEASRG